jgi:hypothetical protein
MERYSLISELRLSPAPGLNAEYIPCTISLMVRQVAIRGVTSEIMVATLALTIDVIAPSTFAKMSATRVNAILPPYS